MTKWSLYLLIPALCLLTITGTTSGQTIRLDRIVPVASVEKPTEAAYQCLYVGERVAVDGDLDDWADVPGMDLREVRYVTSDSGQYPDTWQGPQDLSAKFWLGWNETGVFLAARVIDDVHHLRPDSYRRYWNGDSVCVGFDPKYNASPDDASEEDDREYYFGVHDEVGPELVDAETDEPYQAGRVAGRIVEGGYVVEAWIPWSGLEPLRPPASKACGFAILANDSDGLGQEGWVENVHALYSGAGALGFARLEFVSPALEPGKVLGALVVPKKTLIGGTDLSADVTLLSGTAVPDASLEVSLSGPDEVTEVVGEAGLDKGENRFSLTAPAVALRTGLYALSAVVRSGGQVLWQASEEGITRSSGPTVEDLAPYRDKWNIHAIIDRIEQEPVDPQRGFCFAAMGDNRGGDQVFTKHMNYIETNSPARFTVINGDIVSSGWVEEWLHWLGLVDRLEKPIVPVIGNHDIGDSKKEYRYLFGDPLDFYFDYGGCRIIGMDNSQEGFTPKQLAWADQVIGEAKAQGMYVFVNAHKPPACIEKWAFHAFAAGDEEWVEILTRHKVDGVFVGHIHSYDTAVVDGVPFIITGGAGVGTSAAFGPGSEKHHFIEVHVGPDGVRLEKVTLDHTREPILAELTSVGY